MPVGLMMLGLLVSSAVVFLHQHPLLGTVGLLLGTLRVVVEIVLCEMFFLLFLHFDGVKCLTFALLIICLVLPLVVPYHPTHRNMSLLDCF